MRIAMTGRGSSGSWKMRGEQLGAGLKADLMPNENYAKSFRGYDLIIIVKRISDSNLLAVKNSGVPYIWDIVDAWPQPEGNQWGDTQSLSWLHSSLCAVRPHAVIGATAAMSDDIRCYGFTAFTLYHHSRSDLTPITVREKISRIGYEGAPHYLGRWEWHVVDWCRSNRVEWVKNPTRLESLDVGLALRDPGGYPTRMWKSNVKLANLQAAGIPAVLSDERGYRETASGAERWVYDVSTPDHLIQALDQLKDPAVRQDASSTMLAARDRTSLAALQKEYTEWLRSMKC